MHLLSALLIGLAANLDNFGVGVSYGVQKIKIPMLANFLIALVSGIIMAFSTVAGHALSQYSRLTNSIGALLIVGVGIWVSLHKTSTENDLPVAIPVTKMYTIDFKPLNYIVKVTKNPSAADLDANGSISFKEALVLGFTLSFNCIATGIGAGLTGLEPLQTAFSVFIFSMITISMGYLVGWKTTSHRFEHISQVLAGILLTSIGIYELFF